MNKFRKLIQFAVQSEFSDLHITGGQPLVFRRNGIIGFHQTLLWSYAEIDTLIQTLLNSRQMETLKQRHSVDFALTVEHARIRINVFNTIGGLSIAIRLLPGKIPTIESLNLHPSIHKTAELRSGLILICGATGTGKTTTIAAIIDEINRLRSDHIITLEDPIEYRFTSKRSLVQQREIGTHTLSFERGLLDALREDPDVIVIGELREAETIKLALNAAESGHLVIATLHATNSEEAIYRLCYAFPPEAQNEIRYQLASTLAWLIIQQLVHFEKVNFRIPLLSILRGTSAIKALMRDNKLYQIESTLQTGKTEGMFTFERYYNEFLKLEATFTPPAKIFQPSTETAQDKPYSSPLLAPHASFKISEQKLPEKSLKQTTLSEYQAIPKEETSPLVIDANDSLKDLIDEFGGSYLLEKD